MATNPRIRYDIEANAEGEEDVARLVAQLGKLDDAIDPQAAARAKALGEALQALGNKQAAVSTFLELSAASNTSAKNLEQAQAALRKLEDRLRAVETPTRAQTGQLQKLRDQADRAQQAFTKNTEALNQARGALDRYGISAQDLGSAQERLTAAVRATAAEGRGLVTQYQQTATAAQASGKVQAAAHTGVSEAVKGIRTQLNQVQALAGVALGGSFIGQLAGDVARTADEYNNLAARIRLVTGEGESFDTAFQGVLDIATRTGSALESTGNLFTRISQAGKEFNLTQRDALALTETITQAVQVSGSSAASSDAAITQLIQGLGSGVLRGEEFNSVMEQAPRLARALADGLGVTTGELRKMANQGTLTTDVVIKALKGQAETLKREFDSLPPTVGRALQSLSTAWTAYVGEADKGNSASATAAAAIKALAENLGTAADLLFGLGKAAAAYQALKLAGTLMEAVTATRAVAVATTAATAATVANTAANVANAAAQGATVAGASRLAGIFSTLKAFTFVGVVTNLREIGTAIGENIAKWTGADKALKELERSTRADEAARRSNAAATDEQAQATQRAIDQALGLDKASKALVAEFDGLVKGGSSASDALNKVAKSLELGDTQGIATAITALDVLAQQGKITGAQISAALSAAFKGEDLGAFEARARTAFDGSEQGARRLQLVLDAIANESLKRAGTSVQELQTGFSAAASSAMNDVDALSKTLVAMGVTGEESSRLLSTALDKAIQTASTERAVQALIQKIIELGNSGQLAGDNLTNALEKARRKLDDLKPGVDSLSEALRTMGLQTREQLQGTADKLGAAYRVISNSVGVSLQEQVAAFNRYAQAAIAANGGVESSAIKLERKILENKLAAAGLGDTLTESMRRAGRATDEATAAQRRLGVAMEGNATAGRIGAGGVNDARDENGRTPDELARLREQGGPVDASYNFQVRDRLARGDSFTAEDIPALQNALRATKENINASVRGTGGFYDTATRRDDNMWLALFQRALEKAQGATLLPQPGAAPPAPSGATGGAQGLAVNVFIGNQRRTVNVASQSDADALIKALEEAAGT